MNTFVHIDLLQPLPPGIIQRNKDGAQKTIFHGDAERSAWSTAGQKNRLRKHLTEHHTTIQPATRTRTWTAVSDTLTDEHGWDGALANNAVRALWGLLAGSTKDEDGGDMMLFANAHILDDIIDAALAEPELFELLAKTMPKTKPTKPKKDATDEARTQYEIDIAAYVGHEDNMKAAKIALKEHKSVLDNIIDRLLNADRNPQIALMGRMIAAHPREKVDTALTVGWGISLYPWNRIRSQDFFTAVDDLIGTSGFIDDGQYLGGHMLYRGATVDMQQLAQTLPHHDPKELVDIVISTISSFMAITPQSKRTTSRPGQWPLFTGVRVSDQADGSLQNAFIQSLQPRAGMDVNAEAIKKLTDYYLSHAAAQSHSDVMHYIAPGQTIEEDIYLSKHEIIDEFNATISTLIQTELEFTQQ